MKKETISNRGSIVCRGCSSERLSSILDLGSHPLPAEYGRHYDEVLETFPLHLRICNDCGLGQLGEFVLPERIFHETYPYISSASSTWIEHSRIYANAMYQSLSLNANSLVVELASNDGYLLSEFKQLGVSVLGVEPAAMVANLAIKAGVDTIIDFFGVKLANKILSEHGHPRLIAANNVFAHIPDMSDFMNGMSILADDSTLITIENPSFLHLLKGNLFDTIYHEHYSYLTAHSIQAVARLHSLNLIHIEQLSTHGGSNRYWLSRSMNVNESVDSVLQLEKDAGLFDPNEWLDFAERSKIAIQGLRQWFLERKQAGDTVVGYGAAHKGNTFLNAVGEASRNLLYVVDASAEKQGKFLPGSQVPVLAPEQLGSANPTDVLILPWNIAPELVEQSKKYAPAARIWVAQPSMRQIN